MARAFIAFYMGDYQKKTQHLDTQQHGAYFLLLQHCWTHGAIPLAAAERAAIAKLTPQAWKKIAPTIDRFFDAEGRNKRATEEVAKAEIISTKRAMAGQKGGFQSGRSKSIANAKQMPSKQEAKPQQGSQQKPSICVPIQNSKITTTFSEAAREPGDELATALPAGALRSSPSRESSKLQLSPEAAAIMRKIGA